jgi:uroporphyrinogen decarboxylase
MTSHERVINTISYKKPDRPPIDYSVTTEVNAKLMNYFDINNYEELLCKLGVDFRYLYPRYIGPKEYIGLDYGSRVGRDVWGIVWKSIKTKFGTYYEIASNPLSAANSLEEIEKYNWPNPDWIDVSNLKKEIEKINYKERKAIVFFNGRVFSNAWGIRGFEKFLMDLIVQPEIAETLMKKVADFYYEITKRAIEATDGLIDIIFSGSDIGTQEGMMISPELWRKRVKPWTMRLIEPFKKIGYKTCYHSDGDFTDVIEDFIEGGLDIINPIQPKAKNNNPENLKARFGGKIAFWGGIDTQELLPFGTPERVKEEVIRTINILGDNGGYIVSSSNNIQPDTPMENILSFYRTAQDYRY